MIWVLYVLLAVVILLVAILFLKLNVMISYFHGNDNDELTITVMALFGLIKYKIKIPVVKVAEDSPSLEVKTKMESGQDEKEIKNESTKYDAEDMLQSFQDTEKLLKHVVGLFKIVRRFLRKVAITEIEWNSIVGVGDAAYTGMLTGAIWSIKGSLIGFISSLMKIKTQPKMMITPSFNQAISQTSFRCMIQFRIGHAIFASFKLIKYWKGGMPHFKTKPLSNLSNKIKSV